MAQVPLEYDLPKWIGSIQKRIKHVIDAKGDQTFYFIFSLNINNVAFFNDITYLQIDKYLCIEKNALNLKEAFNFVPYVKVFFHILYFNAGLC